MSRKNWNQLRLSVRMPRAMWHIAMDVLRRAGVHKAADSLATAVRKHDEKQVTKAETDAIPPDRPPVENPVPWRCDPGASQNFVILFDDQDRQLEVFTDFEAARLRYAVARQSWSCYLFAELMRPPAGGRDLLDVVVQEVEPPYRTPFGEGNES